MLAFMVNIWLNTVEYSILALRGEHVAKKLKRVLIKLSGEGFAGGEDFGLDQEAIRAMSHKIQQLSELGIQVAVVVGGGNIVRGQAFARQEESRADADRAGMVGTMVNALTLSMDLRELGVEHRVMSAIAMHDVAETYIQKRALRHLDKGRVVIFGGGLGQPYFTTDTTAVHRGRDIGVDAILMAKTGTDGVYDCDPNANKDARLYLRVSYTDVLTKGLKVMDATAIAMAAEAGLKIIVFGADSETAMLDVVNGNPVGTVVSKKPSVFAQ
jgi:uridylate kinase